VYKKKKKTSAISVEKYH